ncbi:hypothetical protein ERJ75_000656400 [Trypanosoma vivax]|nr:hypothetical protein ERJ75_000656400 [Trypanosoma vivax]
MHAAVDAAGRAPATAHGSLASYIETLARTTDGTATNWKSSLDNTEAKNSPSNVGTALSKSGDAAAKAILDEACPEGMLGKTSTSTTRSETLRNWALQSHTTSRQDKPQRSPRTTAQAEAAHS